MITQHAVRLSLIAMTAVGGLLSAGSAHATIIKLGIECETLVGFTQPVDNKICNSREDFGARVLCKHTGPAIDVLKVVVVADDFRNNNSVACAVVGRTNGQVTFSDGSVNTSVAGTGSNLQAESDVFQPNSTEEVELECVLPPNLGPANCLNHWIIGD
jgi:hypothetical protein